MELDGKSLREAALNCEDCLGWLQHCQAECCAGFRFRLSPTSAVDRTEDEVRIRVRVPDDTRRYYELHGAALHGDAVVVPTDRCRFTHDRLHVDMPCTALTTDFLCSLHTEGKPEVCKALTLETARRQDFWVTPRCLYAYKPEPPASASDLDS